MYHKANLSQETPKGARDIMGAKPKHWVITFLPIGTMCDSVDNNVCGSFNHAIIDSRLYPTISMLENIRCKVMVMIDPLAPCQI